MEFRNEGRADFDPLLTSSNLWHTKMTDTATALPAVGKRVLSTANGQLRTVMLR
jgi:hypothetical protein